MFYDLKKQIVQWVVHRRIINCRVKELGPGGLVEEKPLIEINEEQETLEDPMLMQANNDLALLRSTNVS